MKPGVPDIQICAKDSLKDFLQDLPGSYMMRFKNGPKAYEVLANEKRTKSYQTKSLRSPNQTDKDRGRETQTDIDRHRQTQTDTDRHRQRRTQTNRQAGRHEKWQRV